MPLPHETIRSALAAQPLFEDKTWQLSPEAWPLDAAQVANLRAIGMTAARRALDNEPLARWLMEDVPGAIVDGGPVPDRPGRKRRK